MWCGFSFGLLCASPLRPWQNSPWKRDFQWASMKEKLTIHLILNDWSMVGQKKYKRWHRSGDSVGNSYKQQNNRLVDAFLRATESQKRYPLPNIPSTVTKYGWLMSIIISACLEMSEPSLPWLLSPVVVNKFIFVAAPGEDKTERQKCYEQKPSKTQPLLFLFWLPIGAIFRENGNKRPVWFSFSSRD